MLASELPPPTTMIECENGTFGMLMFHYATAEQRLDHIAEEQGFEVATITLDEDDPLWPLYENGDAAFYAKWRPTKEGWSLALTPFDTDDGPVALFVRPDSGQERGK